MIKITARIYSKTEIEKLEKLLLNFSDCYHTKSEFMRQIVSRGVDVLEFELAHQRKERENLITLQKLCSTMTDNQILKLISSIDL